jgi:hypothetical protein
MTAADKPDDESLHARGETYATFDEWMDEIEGVAPRALRAAEDLGKYWEKWLRTAWELGAEAERQKALDDVPLHCPGCDGDHL